MMRYLLNAVCVLVAIVGLAIVIDTGAQHLGVQQALAEPPPILIDAGASAGSDTGSAVAPVPTVSAHDAITSPQDSLSDAQAAKKHGWPIFVIVCLIMVAKTLQTAGKRWPDIKSIAWLNSGMRAAIITGVITIGTASCDTVLNGGSWFTVAYAAAGSFLLLVHPSPATKPVATA
jgi:hypothetical protein